MDEIFAIESLSKLRTYLESKPRQSLRSRLIKRFLKLCCYKNAEEWNKAVRLCEALAIIGWGDNEPVQAERGMFWNGNPETAFFNRYSEFRFVDAIWSKRKAGFTMEPGRTTYNYSPDLPNKKSQGDDYPVRECVQDIRLETQRNWIPKNPILIGPGIANCSRKSKKLIAEVEKRLMPALDKQMTPEQYGTAINRIYIQYNLSYCDESGPENYIILDEDVRISTPELYKRLRKMFSAKEIDKNGYYLRKRFDFGSFRPDRGHMKVEIHFPKEFNEQPTKAQKREFARHMTEAVDGVVSRLKSKRLDYDLDKMNRDFQAIVRTWVG